MAIQWADDFSRYGTGDAARGFMLDGLPYASIGSLGDAGRVVTNPAPDEDDLVFAIGANGNDWERDFRIALPTVITTNTLGLAARFYLSSLPADDNNRATLIHFQNGSGTIVVMIRVEQNGSIEVLGRVSDTLTTVADTVNPVIAPASWNHFELVHNNSTGAGTLWINGVSTLTYTGVDTDENLELTNCSGRNNSGANPIIYVKDLVIWDGTGTQNNSTAGTVIVRRLKPNADDTLGGWTASTGSTGFNLLAKDVPNDSTYLSADDTPPAAMEFDLENLPPDITSVRALLPVVRMRKIDGGDATVQSALSPNGTDYDSGADRPVTTTFTYYFDVSELDPSDASPWTPVDVDSTTIRVDRTT